MPEASPALTAELAEALPARIAVGRGTCLFVRGSCRPPDLPIRALDLIVGGRRHDAIAHGVDLDGSPGSFWGIAALPAVERSQAVALELAPRADGRAIAPIPLGILELVRDLEAIDVDVRPPPGEGPLVAICMATFDPPIELLRAQLASIREQTHTRWVCLISDDASAPESHEALRDLVAGDDRIAVSRSPDRLGAYRNFERALTMVPPQASFVALADQDDRWHPDKLAALIGGIGDAALAYSDMRITSESGEVRSETFWRGRRNNHTNLASLLLANTVTGAASLFRRELLDLVLPFPPEVPDSFHDQWIASAALTSGAIAYIDRPLYDYVQHGSASLGHAAAMRGYHPLRRLRRSRPRTVLAGLADHGRRSYFLNAVRIAVAAGTLELRAGERLRGPKGRAVRRLTRLGTRREPVGWLAARSLRPLAGRNETAGIELSLLAAVLWRRSSRRGDR